MNLNKILVVISLTLAVLLIGVTSLYFKERQTVNVVSASKTDGELLVEDMLAHGALSGVALQDEAWTKYSRSGKMLASGESTSDILKGRKVVLYITQNNCDACRDRALHFMNDFWLETGKTDAIVIVANYPLSEESTALKVGKEGFYTINGGDLGLGLGPHAEIPVLMLVNDGIVDRAFPVTGVTREYIGVFRDFLRSRLDL